MRLEQKLPIIGDYFIKETPPSDNVSESEFNGIIIADDFKPF